MGQEEAEHESRRRWCKSPRSGRRPIADRKGDRYRVGYDDGEFRYVLGCSPQGWAEAFADYDRRAT